MNHIRRAKYIIDHTKEIRTYNTIIYFLKRVISPKEKVSLFNVKDLKSKMYLRSKTYNINGFYQIFIDKESNVKSNNVKKILDLGANIGLSTLFFNKKYLGSKILSFESSLENCRLEDRMDDTFLFERNLNGCKWNH